MYNNLKDYLGKSACAVCDIIVRCFPSKSRRTGYNLK